MPNSGTASHFSFVCPSSRAYLHMARHSSPLVIVQFFFSFYFYHFAAMATSQIMQSLSCLPQAWRNIGVRFSVRSSIGTYARLYVRPSTFATTLASNLLFRSVTLKPLRYFDKTWNKYKAFSDNVDRTRTKTPTTSFRELCPLCKFQYANRIHSITQKPGEIFSLNLVQI